MGNNPSRTHTHTHQHHSSTSSSSPRPTASRRPSYRRNSLQHPPAPPRPATGGTHLQTPHYAPPPRRESVAEGVIPSRLIDDVATLQAFPAPPTFQDINFGRAGVRRGSMESTASAATEAAEERDTRAVPTLVQWPYDGNKVYLTGTFCGWAKKYRLQRSPSGGVMAAVVPIPPGTHHVKFLVDGEMRTSQAIPTAVDDTGILVNYLEVSADDMPPLNRQPSHEQSHQPPLPAAAEQKHYTTEIPVYLRDFVEADEPPSLEGGPPPPSLPMMLQKVILNTSSQMRDDASVLSIPNHAVLNHLATSSIKNHILAVSATTRYKKKYVTTILYKAAGLHH